MFRQGVERNINAAPLEIARHVLPEIGKLQRGTRVVGELLPLGVAITTQVKHQAAHRVGRIAAIEIGRASCRERVENAEGAVPVKEKTTDRSKMHGTVVLVGARGGGEEQRDTRVYHARSV